MCNEDVIHIHSGVLFCCLRKNKIIKFTGKWVEIENIILSVTTQTPPNKYVCIILYVDVSF